MAVRMKTSGSGERVSRSARLESLHLPEGGVEGGVGECGTGGRKHRTAQAYEGPELGVNMSSYLRDDLWARPYISLGEQYASQVEPDSVLKLSTRYQFGKAVAAASAQFLLNVIPTLILGVGCVIAFPLSMVVEARLFGRITHQFHEWNGRMLGSMFGAIIATASMTTHTGISQYAEMWLLSRLAQNWGNLRTKLEADLQSRVASVRSSRVSGTVEEERYSISHGGRQQLYFDVLAEEMATKLRKRMETLEGQMNERGIDETTRAARMRSAIRDIHAFVRKKKEQTGSLPMTYVQVGEYRLENAYKLKQKAVKFLDTQAKRIGDIALIGQPNKFDAAGYQQKVASYRERVNGDFDKEILKLQEHVTKLKTVWDERIPQLIANRRESENAISSLMWQLKWFGWFLASDDESKAQYQKQMAELQLASRQNQALLQQRVSYLRAHEFSDIEWQFRRYDNFFAEHVGARGIVGGNWVLGGAKIVRELEWYAKPPIVARWYRSWVSPVVSLGPKALSKFFEDIFDPDVDPARRGGGWRLGAFLNSVFN